MLWHSELHEWVIFFSKTVRNNGLLKSLIELTLPNDGSFENFLTVFTCFDRECHRDPSLLLVGQVEHGVVYHCFFFPFADPVEL